MADAKLYRYLDPGIRDVVRYLREREFNTTDSGDGVTKIQKYGNEVGALPFKHVVIECSLKDMIQEADRASLAMEDHRDEWLVEAIYCPTRSSVIIFVSELTKP